MNNSTYRIRMTYMNRGPYAAPFMPVPRPNEPMHQPHNPILARDLRWAGSSTAARAAPVVPRALYLATRGAVQCAACDNGPELVATGLCEAGCAPGGFRP